MLSNIIKFFRQRKEHPFSGSIPFDTFSPSDFEVTEELSDPNIMSSDSEGSDNEAELSRLSVMIGQGQPQTFFVNHKGGVTHETSALPINFQALLHDIQQWPGYCTFPHPSGLYQLPDLLRWVKDWYAISPEKLCAFNEHAIRPQDFECFAKRNIILMPNSSEAIQSHAAEWVIIQSSCQWKCRRLGSIAIKRIDDNNSEMTLYFSRDRGSFVECTLDVNDLHLLKQAFKDDQFEALKALAIPDEASLPQPASRPRCSLF